MGSQFLAGQPQTAASAGRMAEATPEVSHTSQYVVHIEDITIPAASTLKISRMELTTTTADSPNGSRKVLVIMQSDGGGRWSVKPKLALSSGETLLLRPYCSSRAFTRFGKRIERSLVPIPLVGADIHETLEGNPGRHSYSVPDQNFVIVIGLIASPSAPAIQQVDSHISDSQISQTLTGLHDDGSAQDTKTAQALSDLESIVTDLAKKAELDETYQIPQKFSEIQNKPENNLALWLEKLSNDIKDLLNHVADPQNESRIHSETNTIGAILQTAINALEFIADGSRALASSDSTHPLLTTELFTAD
ncbi:hypothetical protein OF83DRAFT_491979 [Amylostereum chailletii]|nr:hypothetical protein OF83DRAFT_491979 [Amylostereum chailletii]